MKLTWIGPYKPVPDRSGADLRSYYLMRELSRRGASINGYFLGSHGETCEQFLEESRVFDPRWLGKQLRAVWRRFSGEPLTVGRFYHPELADQFSENDMIYVDHLHMLPNVLGMDEPRYWLDEHNLESDLWRQYANRSYWAKRRLLEVEENRLRQYETRAIRCSAGTSLPSLAGVERLPGDLRKKITEVSNGVPDCWLDEGRRRLDRPFDPDGVFGFIGEFNWFPNKQGMDRFLERVWRSFHREHPGTSLKLAGAGPPDRWSTYDGVDVLGYVDSKDAFFDSIDALVLPLELGSGTRLKALEAAALGVPILSTQKGVEGLTLPELPTTGSIDGLRELMVKLLEEPDCWQDRREGVHGTVREIYRWETIGDRLWDAMNGVRSNED